MEEEREKTGQSFMFQTYVCGNGSEIMQEKIFSMGEALNRSRKLDMNEEKLLIEELMIEL